MQYNDIRILQTKQKMLKIVKLILEIISYFWTLIKTQTNGINNIRRKPNKHEW
jgi:hypothetical protein